MTRYDYDEVGNEIHQIDALNRTNVFAYDGMGRRISHTMPGGQSEGMAYDVAGNLVLQTNCNGVVLTNQYDTMNRLLSRTGPGGYQIGYTYTLTGQRATMTDASGTNTYSYDVRNRLLQKIVNFNSGVALSLDYLYDANGNLTNLWSGTVGGVTNVYQYDALNRLTNVQADGSSAASYGFDGVGNLQSGAFGNGVTNLYQYDKLNRLTNAVWNLGSSARASFYYQLGLTGNRTNLNETIQGTNHLYNWQYDPIYRLTNENISTAGTVAYGLDAVGNRTNRTSSVTGLADQTQAYNTNDWLTTDAYDSNGNTIWTTNGGTPIGPYKYDAENHLTNFNSIVTITYNGDGLRASKSVGGTNTNYLVDDRNPTGYAQVVEEWSSTGGSPALSKVYNYGLSLISQRVPSTSTNYFIYDGHGSTRILTDAAGTVVNAFVYDAYGNLIASNTTAQTLYLFCSEQWDPDINQYYFRARTFNPNTGRFLTADTSEGDQEDPLSLHKYLYCSANPINMTDPAGHDSDGIDDIDPSAMDSFLSPVDNLAAFNFLRTINVTIFIGGGAPSNFDKRQVQNLLLTQMSGKVFDKTPKSLGVGISLLNGPATTLGWSGNPKNAYGDQVKWVHGDTPGKSFARTQDNLTLIDLAHIEQEFSHRPEDIGTQLWVNILAHEVFWHGTGTHPDTGDDGDISGIQGNTTTAEFTVSPSSKSAILKDFGLQP